MRAPNARTSARLREGGSGHPNSPERPELQASDVLEGVVLDDDDPRPSGGVEPAVLDLEPEAPGATRSKSPVQWRKTPGGRRVVQHPDYGAGNWVAQGAGAGGRRLAGLLGVVGVPVAAAVVLATSSTRWAYGADLLCFAAAIASAWILTWLSGWDRAGRWVGRLYAVRGGYFTALRGGADKEPVLEPMNGYDYEMSPLLRVGMPLVPIGLWVVTLGQPGLFAGVTLLAVSCTLLAARVVRATSEAWYDMAAREERAFGWLEQEPEDDPWVLLRKDWKEGPGAPDSRSLLRGSRLITNDAVFTVLPDRGIRAAVSLAPGMKGGWQALMADSERQVVARQFSTTADLVFWGPHRQGASHAMLTVHRKDPLTQTVAWRKPTLDKGGFVVARLADGSEARWPIWRGDMGTPHGLVVGGTGSGKSSPLTALLLEAGLSDCWTVLMDPKGGLSLPAITEDRVDHRAVRDEDIVRTLAAVAAVMEARMVAQAGNVAPSADFPAVVAVLDEAPDILAEHPDADRLINDFVRPILRKGRAVNVALYLGAQHPTVGELGGGRANAAGGAALRAQIGNLAALRLNDKAGRGVVAQWTDGIEIPVPPNMPGAGSFAAADGSIPPMRGRAVFADATSLRTYDALRKRKTPTVLDQVSRDAWDEVMTLEETPA